MLVGEVMEAEVAEAVATLEDIMADTVATIVVVCMLHFEDTMAEDTMGGVIPHSIGGVQ